MSNAYTPAIKLALPASGDRTWNVALNSDISALDAVNAVGDLAVTTHEQPSASLLFDAAPGLFTKQDGSTVSYAGASSVAVTASSTNYVYLTPTGTLTVNTTGFVAGASVPLAVVVAGAATISSVADARVCYQVVGPFLDGTGWTLGTSSGLQIGTSSSQKLGFYGGTPVVQPTLGAATATGTYGSNEEGMLQRVYNAVRALGLGS